MDSGSVFVITDMSVKGRVRRVCALLEDERPVEISCLSTERSGILGGIYVGKVKNLAANIGAAFVEIADGIICHFPIEEAKRYPLIFTRPKSKSQLAAGDELLVQVSREAMGTKPPTVTGNLSFTGRYLVLTSGKRQVGVSSKLGSEERERLKKEAEDLRSTFCGEYRRAAGDGAYEADFGLIVRTNAEGASREELEEELFGLYSLYERTVTLGRSRALFSLVYREPSEYAVRILGLPKERLKKIVTDIPEIYDEMNDFLSERMPDARGALELRAVTGAALSSVYGLFGAFDEALQKRVWLKSGGYLIIEYTEALTVIDVNTGKFTGDGRKKDVILKTNLEAARETARQLRLRNLSGIIIIDFIDMEHPKDRVLLMETLEGELKKDPVKTALVDMTKLGLVEITRKKIRPALHESI